MLKNKSMHQTRKFIVSCQVYLSKTHAISALEGTGGL